jgi:hypothetical protein
LVAANRKLIARMKNKIQATLARIWDDTPAPPKPPRLETPASSFRAPQNFGERPGKFGDAPPSEPERLPVDRECSPKSDERSAIGQHRSPK